MLFIALLACGASPGHAPPPPRPPLDGASGDSSPAVESGAVDSPAGGETGEVAGGETGAGGASPPPLALIFEGEVPRSVLLISVDTTRRDSLPWFGGGASTPNLQALVEGGLLLADHRSCSNWTYASVLCFQSGRSDVDMGFIPEGTTALAPLPRGTLLGPSLFAANGWSTALVSANSFFGSGVGTDRGFETSILVDAADADAVNDKALPLLDAIAAADGPWHAHVHYMDPHSPYTPPEAFLEGLKDLAPIEYDLDNQSAFRSMVEALPQMDEAERALTLEHLRVRYEGEIAYVDDRIGALLDHAGALGLLDDALVVFWTDHGEQRYEHEHIGHNEGLWEQENRSVVAFWAPGLAPGVWDRPTVHQDIYPTLLALHGLPTPQDWTGIPVGQRPAGSARLAFRHRFEESLQFVERADRKLMYWWTGERAFFHLDEDPEEKVDQYDPADKEVQALWALLLPEVERAAAILKDYTPVDPGP